MTIVYNSALSIVQNVSADANNSSSTNLAVGNSYTFTGTKTSTLGVAGIRVSLYADKNCKVQVQQSPDATPNWDLTDTYFYTASSNFGVTVQAVSSYVRVVVTTANETTTTFRLQTALCPIVEAVPRSLDEWGNFKIANPMDSYGFDVENTPMGEMDAGIYKITDDVAVVLTTDFFTPIVDDPYWFGAIAAANSLSDVWAMGGKAVVSLNIAMFPSKPEFFLPFTR